MQDKVIGPVDAALILAAAATITTTTDTTSFDTALGQTPWSDSFPPDGGGAAVNAIVEVTSCKVSATNETYSVKVQESSDGSTWTDASRTATFGTGTISESNTLAAGGVIRLAFNWGKQYLRLVFTLGGTSPSLVYGNCYFQPLVNSAG